MNKADTKTAKAKDLTERSPFLEFPMMMMRTGRDDWSGNHFLPKGWQIDNEGNEVYDKRPYPVKRSIVTVLYKIC